jgi:hypothetical protein
MVTNSCGPPAQLLMVIRKLRGTRYTVPAIVNSMGVVARLAPGLSSAGLSSAGSPTPNAT